jgi:hypothetical protein
VLHREVGDPGAVAGCVAEHGISAVVAAAEHAGNGAELLADLASVGSTKDGRIVAGIFPACAFSTCAEVHPADTQCPTPLVGDRSLSGIRHAPPGGMRFLLRGRAAVRQLS